MTNPGWNCCDLNLAVGNGAKHSLSNYIDDSIVDDKCSLGTGTVLANFRLDEGNILIKVADSLVDTGYDKLGPTVGRGCCIGVNARPHARS